MTYTDLEMLNSIGLTTFDCELLGIKPPQYKSAIHDVNFLEDTRF